MVAAWKRAAGSPHLLSLEPSIDCRPGRRRHPRRAGSARDLLSWKAPTWPHGELEVSPRLLSRPAPCSCHRWRASSCSLLDVAGAVIEFLVVKRRSDAREIKNKKAKRRRGRLAPSSSVQDHHLAPLLVICLTVASLSFALPTG